MASATPSAPSNISDLYYELVRRPGGGPDGLNASRPANERGKQKTTQCRIQPNQLRRPTALPSYRSKTDARAELEGPLRGKSGTLWNNSSPEGKTGRNDFMAAKKLLDLAVFSR